MVKITLILESKKRYWLIFKYIVFALLSICVNIGSQWIFNHLYHGSFSLYFGLFLGTGLGLYVKFILDKRFIFFFKIHSNSRKLGKFLLYAMMGIITTIIFWGSELAFHYIYATDNAKYWGGLVGLFLGYCIKYNLDKKWVFNR